MYLHTKITFVGQGIQKLECALDQMILIYELGIDILKMYVHSKGEVSR